MLGLLTTKDEWNQSEVCFGMFTPIINTGWIEFFMQQNLHVPTHYMSLTPVVSSNSHLTCGALYALQSNQSNTFL